MNLHLVVLIHITVLTLTTTLCFRNFLATVLLLPLVLSSILYTSWPVLEQLLIGITPFRGTPLTDTAATEILLLSSGSSLLAALILQIIISVFSETSWHLRRAFSTYNGKGAPLLVIISIMLLFFATNLQPWKLSNYETAIMVSRETPLISLSRTGISLGCTLGLLGLFNTAKLITPTALAYLITPLSLALLTSNKHSLLPLASLLLILTIQKKTKQESYLIQLAKLFTLSLFLLCSLLFMKAFSIHRGGGNVLELIAIAKSTEWHFLSITGSDPGGPYVSLSEEFNLGIETPERTDLIRRIKSITPKALLDGTRPEAVDIEFAKTNIPNWEPGLGLGYHPLSDFHSIGGNTIAVLYFPSLLVIGFTFLFLIHRFPNTKATSSSAILILFGTSLISHRTMIEGFFKYLATNTAVPILMTAIIVLAINACLKSKV